MKTSTFACLLLAALALSGCCFFLPCDRLPTNAPIQDSCLIRVRTADFRFENEPLWVQVSEGSKAYIWQFSDELINPDEVFYGKNAPVSTLADVQPQAALYKQAQDHQNKYAPVMITGDIHAKCGAVFEAIANTKRAGITAFYFASIYMPSGQTISQIPRQGQIEDSFPSINPSSKPVTITIFKDNTIAWDNKPMTMIAFVNRLFENREAVQNGNIRFIVEVDAQAEFPTLRYVLDQILRANNKSVTVELRELK